MPRRSAQSSSLLPLVWCGLLAWCSLLEPIASFVRGLSRHNLQSSLAAHAEDSQQQGYQPMQTEDLLQLLQRPGAADDVKEIMRKLLDTEEKATDANATAQQLLAGILNPGSQDVDPLAKLIADPQGIASLMQSDSKEEQLGTLAQNSPLFDKLLQLGSRVLEQTRISRLEPGTEVELAGLKAAADLNGLRGFLTSPTPEEEELSPGRRIVELEDDAGRIAVQPENLRFPRYLLGNAVTLETKFEVGGPHEGLERRAAVVSELTEEEIELGFKSRGGQVVVEVLSLLPGGPVLERILMWPEHLRPRAFQPGDGVEIAGLEADTSLNGEAATVEAGASGPGRPLLVALDGDGRPLEIKPKNLRLVSCGFSAGGFG